MKGERRPSDGQRILNKLTPEERADLQKALEDRERFRQEQERRRQERR